MMSLKFCVLLVFAYIVCEVESLDVGDKGACVVKLSYMESRKRIFTARINKMCGGRQCVVKRAKMEHYPTWKNHTICCNGWQHNSDLDVCEPVCSTGCNDGKCIAPDVCHCEPPLHLDPEHVNRCIPYVCDPPCVGGVCWGNNICKCLPNLNQYNATHCVPCGEGFTINPQLECEPKCDQKCVNSTCVAPNTCKCLDGYRSKDDFTCEPICDCMNAECVAPGTCSCYPGYKSVNATHCIPVCENCGNGICIKPHNCSCNEGYSRADGICKPVCDKACVNGVCTAPNVCECREGYVKKTSNPHVCYQPCGESCEGTCDAQGVCQKGLCEKTQRLTRRVPKRVNNVRICRGRRTCIVMQNVPYTVRQVDCCNGWLYSNTSGTCSPICTPDCINGTCIGPNQCQCEPPLLLYGNTCELPVCEPICGTYSLCTGTNNCTCVDGFVPINSTHCGPSCLPGFFNDPVECSPRCNNPCVNGTCTAPDTCTCNAGYSEINNYTCQPKCDPSCENADCIEPNVCSCLDGYTQENEWKCTPVCANCSHGDCIAPGNCECHKGYAKNDGVCQPVCQKPCSNGMCVEPDQCQCNVGYELDPHDKFNCLPICEPKCVNASCVSPNKCSCLSGYQTAGNNWTCKPTCDGCDNGDCIEPNNCRCHQGYEKLNGKCKPKCSKNCLNGECTAPEVCSCVERYTLSREDKYTCNPICEPACVNSSCVAPGDCKCLPNYESTEAKHICKPQCKSCVNGDCVAPNVCRCHHGYEEKEGVCSPICEFPCVNGQCSAPNTCDCVEGYQKNSTSPNICFKECVDGCDPGVCDLHGICTCDPGYELLNNTCVEIPPVDCSTCVSNCSADGCWCVDGKPCFPPSEVPAEVTSSTSLAGLELTWMLGAAVGFLLIVFVLVVMLRIGKKRQQYGSKSAHKDGPFGSVVYTVPDTLIHRQIPEENEETQDRFYEEVTLDGRRHEAGTTDRLLEGDIDERL